MNARWQLQKGKRIVWNSKSLCPVQVNMVIPITYMVFWAVLLGFSLYSEPVVCGLGMVIMLTGVPVYFVGVRWRAKPKWIYRLVGKLVCATIQSLFKSYFNKYLDNVSRQSL